MEKILCITSSATEADNVLLYAGSICKKVGAELTLMNNLLNPPDLKQIPAKMGLERESLMEALEKKVQMLSNHFDLEARIHLHFEYEVPDLSKNISGEFDLMIMGVSDARSMSSFFQDGQTFPTPVYAGMPLLLIPRNCLVHRVESIVYAFSYGVEEDVPFKQLYRFATDLGATITVLQVNEHYNREAEQNSQLVEERLKLLYNMVDLSCETVFNDNVSRGVSDFLVDRDVQVLALCTPHGNPGRRIFHPNVIDELIGEVSCPLLIFHD